MTLQQLADKVGTSASALHRYETGWDRFEVATLRRIATALGAHLDVRLIESRTVERPSPAALVEQLAPLFWDKRLTVVDLEAHPAWVLSRVLRLGDWVQVRAARSFFGDAAIRDVIGRRGMDARTRAYWKVMLGREHASASTR